VTPTGLRVIGTGYLGKEPFEHTVDVLCGVLRATGVEIGFSSCLTSRPFTARTFVAERPGAMMPGRHTATGRDRAIGDLVDGLDTLAAVGFKTTVACPTDVLDLPADGPVVVVVGPLRVPGRWAPAADRLIQGEVWRHVILDGLVGDQVVGLDPTAGGYTALSRAELDGPSVTAHVVTAPQTPLDVAALARHCFARGAVWRAASSGADLDERGLATAVTQVDLLTSGGAPRRARLSFAAYGLHALRAGALLGACGPLHTGQLALADLLAELVTRCREAQAALRAPDADTLASVLSRMAVTVEAASELYRREAVPE
jgi:hypothetical protein